MARKAAQATIETTGPKTATPDVLREGLKALHDRGVAEEKGRYQFVPYFPTGAFHYDQNALYKNPPE